MATPSQLTKNMITNASFRSASKIHVKYQIYLTDRKIDTLVTFGFRTKKMEADIARVETEEDGERMGVIR